jgi:hypothetical protein
MQMDSLLLGMTTAVLITTSHTFEVRFRSGFIPGGSLDLPGPINSW